MGKLNHTAESQRGAIGVKVRRGGKEEGERRGGRRTTAQRQS